MLLLFVYLHSVLLQCSLHSLSLFYSLTSKDIEIPFQYNDLKEEKKKKNKENNNNQKRKKNMQEMQCTNDQNNEKTKQNAYKKL